MWYLIVLIPDLCHLSYFVSIFTTNTEHLQTEIVTSAERYYALVSKASDLARDHDLHCLLISNKCMSKLVINMLLIVKS